MSEESTAHDEEQIRVSRLWGRVVQQAVAEAEGRQMYGVAKSEIPGVQRRAQRWLRTRSRSFTETCTLAGMNAAARERLLANAHDSEWRKRFLRDFKVNFIEGKR